MRGLKLAGILFLLTLAWCDTAFAGELPADVAVKALIGECGGQSEAEKYAHACALFNRGTTKGVFGSRAIMERNGEWWRIAYVRTEGNVEIYRDIERITPFSQAQMLMLWQKAITGENDVVRGRTEWRSDYDLKLMASKGQTPQSQGLYDPLKIGQTTFYRLKGKR